MFVCPRELRILAAVLARAARNLFVCFVVDIYPSLFIPRIIEIGTRTDSFLRLIVR